MRRRFVALGLAALLVAAGVASLGGAISQPSPDQDVDPDPLRTHQQGERPTADLERATADLGSDSADGSTERPSDAERVLGVENDLALAAAGDQVVRGESSLRPGTHVLVVVANRDPDFVAIRSTRVALDGTFRARFDLSNLPVATEVTVRAYNGDDPVDVRNVTLTEPAPGTTLDTRWNRMYFEPEVETVRGTTDLDPGTTLTVTVDSMGDTDLEQNRTVTVRSDGTFRATFDLEEVPHATHLRVAVYDDGERIDYAHGLVFD